MSKKDRTGSLFEKTRAWLTLKRMWTVLGFVLGTSMILVVIMLVLGLDSYLSYTFSGLALAFSVLFYFIQRYQNEEDFLNSRKDAWLSQHYRDLANKLEDPFLANDKGYSLQSYLNFLNPREKLMTVNVGKNPIVSLFDLEKKNTLFIKDQDVIDHLNTGYKGLTERLGNVLNLTTDFYSKLDSLISRMNEQVEASFKKVLPSIKNMEPEKFNENEDCYSLILCMQEVLFELKELVSDRPAQQFQSSSTNHGRIAINGNPNTVAFLPQGTEIKGILTSLDEVVRNNIDQIREYIKEKEEIEKKWKLVDEEIRQIYNDVEQSGIPVNGECHTCSKTKSSRRLILPPN